MFPTALHAAEQTNGVLASPAQTSLKDETLSGNFQGSVGQACQEHAKWVTGSPTDMQSLT